MLKKHIICDIIGQNGYIRGINIWDTPTLVIVLKTK